MSYSSLFLLLSVFISSNLIKYNNSKLIKGITLAMIFSVMLALFKLTILTTIGFYLFGVSALVFLILSIQRKQWVSIIISFFVVLSVVFKMLQLPFLNELNLIMIIPVMTFLLTFIHREKYTSIYATIIILTAYNLSELLSVWF